MVDTDLVKKAKEKAEELNKKTNEKIESYLNNALKYFAEFSEDMDQNTLKKSAEFFFKVLNIKKTLIEPYIYLSYIFYLFDENEISIHYLKIAESINPKYKQIKELQNLLKDEK